VQLGDLGSQFPPDRLEIRSKCCDSIDKVLMQHVHVALPLVHSIPKVVNCRRDSADSIIEDVNLRLDSADSIIEGAEFRIDTVDPRINAVESRLDALQLFVLHVAAPARKDDGSIVRWLVTRAI